LFWADDYGFGDYVKLFFNSGAKRVVKRIEFKDTALSQVAAVEWQRAVGFSAELLAELQKPVEPMPLPSALPPLPQSTYDEFARARPQRVRNGYVRGTKIEEEVVASFNSGNRVWFGKSFYDGEGISGVGAIGYFDRTTNKYTLLRIPEVVNSSVSYLVVEGELIWAGLVVHPEAADDSAGLLVHDMKTASTRIYPVTDVISKIVRGPDGLYVMTTNGLYVLKGQQLTRHRVEPDFNGKPAIYTEQLQ
jgi:hypothetical protein